MGAHAEAEEIIFYFFRDHGMQNIVQYGTHGREIQTLKTTGDPMDTATEHK